MNEASCQGSVHIDQSNNHNMMVPSQSISRASSINSASSQDKKSSGKFPYKLYDMLEYATSDAQWSSAVCWSPGEESFAIRDREKLVKLLPLFFQQSKFRSFTRQLNLWGFSRTTPEVWAHSNFKRGNTQGLELITYVKVKGGKKGDGPKKSQLIRAAHKANEKSKDPSKRSGNAKKGNKTVRVSASTARFISTNPTAAEDNRSNGNSSPRIHSEDSTITQSKRNRQLEVKNAPVAHIAGNERAISDIKSVAMQQKAATTAKQQIKDVPDVKKQLGQSASANDEMLSAPTKQYQRQSYAGNLPPAQNGYYQDSYQNLHPYYPQHHEIYQAPEMQSAPTKQYQRQSSAGNPPPAQSGYYQDSYQNLHPYHPQHHEIYQAPYGNIPYMHQEGLAAPPNHLYDTWPSMPYPHHNPYPYSQRHHAHPGMTMAPSLPPNAPTPQTAAAPVQNENRPSHIQRMLPSVTGAAAPEAETSRYMQEFFGPKEHQATYSEASSTQKSVVNVSHQAREDTVLRDIPNRQKDDGDDSKSIQSLATADVEVCVSEMT